MIVPGQLDDATRAGFDAALARVRALEARIVFGCGQVVLMAAGTEGQLAAWRVRNDELLA